MSALEDGMFGGFTRDVSSGEHAQSVVGFPQGNNEGANREALNNFPSETNTQVPLPETVSGRVQVFAHPRANLSGKLGSQPAEGNGGTTNNADDKLASIMFHNPFDVNSYPMTNPPIFDSTLMLPYTSEGVPRRRRVSISNGQIGQIVSHEAVVWDGDGDNLMEEVFYPGAQVPPATQTNVPIPPVGGAVGAAPMQGSPFGLQQQTPVHSDDTAISGMPAPNQQLIYNNEVIYNPSNGPMPGTAAWKKERLLERNRIAASKCRQRKKKAHQQLQDTIVQYEKELKEIKGRFTRCNVLVDNLKKSINEKESPMLDAFIREFKQIMTEINQKDSALSTND